MKTEMTERVKVRKLPIAGGQILDRHSKVSCDMTAAPVVTTAETEGVGVGVGIEGDGTGIGTSRTVAAEGVRMRVIGYLRVSTLKQEYGIDAQRAAIATEAGRRGWEVVWIEDAGRSGKDIDRPGIQRALHMLKMQEAEGLVVAKLDRLSRSLSDLARVLEVSSQQHWGVIALDLGVDTTTPTGELVAPHGLGLAVGAG